MQQESEGLAERNDPRGSRELYKGMRMSQGAQHPLHVFLGEDSPIIRERLTESLSTPGRMEVDGQAVTEHGIATASRTRLAASAVLRPRTACGTRALSFCSDEKGGRRRPNVMHGTRGHLFYRTAIRAYGETRSQRACRTGKTLLPTAM